MLVLQAWRSWRNDKAVALVARRKPDVTFAVAEADVTRVAAEIAAEDPVNHPAWETPNVPPRVLELPPRTPGAAAK
jgi:hypothetical protein